MAWEWFGPRNGCPTFEVMRERIETIRQRFGYRGHGPANEIGCILIVQPVFFAKDDWVAGPRDWPERNLRHMRYDLTQGSAFGRSAFIARLRGRWSGSRPKARRCRVATAHR